jgi:TetR/AcrR family transcriptional regulator, repressor of fatR-cypB operon
VKEMARERKFSTESLFQATRELLLAHGYEGFTFALLADQLEVARGTIYKYYENKEELITDFMVYEMDHFLNDLNRIGEYRGFVAQFDFLIDIIFRDNTIPQLISVGQQIPVNNEKVKVNKAKINVLQLDMYKHLQAFISLGREEKILKPTIPDGLLLGMIFQTIAIPNHFNVPRSVWVESIKEILCHGMFTTS